MALGETANLVVQLRLDDKISAPLRGVNASLTKMGVNTGLVGKGLGQVGKGLALTVARGAGLAAVGLGLVSTQVVAGVKALQELEDVQAQTTAAIKSTGGAAGVTAVEVRKLAEEYETLGGVIDDKVIQSAENILLTFPRIQKEAFEPALQAALDLSTRLGTDLKSATIQVGKALADPVRGLTALRRVGVTFTDDQQKLIKALVEENDLYGAQQLILQELEKEFGGSFAARGKTQAATIGRMKDAIEELQKTLAAAFIPVIDKVARKLTALFQDPEVIRGVREFGQRLASFATEENLNAVGDAVRNVFGYLAQVPWGTIGDGLKIAGQATKVVVDAFNALPKEVQGIVISAIAVQKLSGGLVGAGLGNILKGLTGGLFNRGGTPATPIFTKEVGLPGAGGGLLGGKGGLAGTLLKGGLGVVGGLLVHDLVKELLRGDNAFTPSGPKVGRPDLAPPKTGVVPVKVTNQLSKAAFDNIGSQIKVAEKATRQALKDGDIHAARLADRQVNVLNALRGTVNRNTNGIIPKLGQVNRALSVANRNLDDGNRRQREIAQGVREARDRIGSGFQRSNDQLGIIARKPTQFTASVTNNITATLSTYQSLQTMSRVNTIRTSYAPGDSTGGSV